MTEPDRFTRRIRPYVLTGGRTRPAMDLPLETQIRSAVDAEEVAGLGAEARAIVELCRRPYAVAEVAARTGQHLQVTKILVGDLLNEGLLVSDTIERRSERSDLNLLERVLDGLQGQ